MVDIGGLRINQLSGPVSFHYYFPSEKAFRENAEKGVFLPIIILLGDEHNSEADRCDPCDEEKGCFMVESDTFLQTLDKLAQTYPIDIYTEYSPKKELRLNGGVLFNRFIRQNTDCYERTYFKNKKEYKCNFPKIKWHYADPRYCIGKVERDASLAAIYMNDIILGKDVNTNEFRTLMKTSLFQQFLKHMIEMGDTNRPMTVLCNKLAFLLKQTLQNTDESIIKKQLKRATLDLDIEMYCRSSLRFHGVMTEENVNNVFEINRVNVLYEHVFEDRPITFVDKINFRTSLSRVLNMWAAFTACLLDIYFLARMAKQKSYVTLGFFGHRHCDALLDFIETDLYTFKYSSKNSGRCLQLNGRLDFNEHLRTYQRWRSAYSR
jgi:hypothetical protein